MFSCYILTRHLFAGAVPVACNVLTVLLKHKYTRLSFESYIWVVSMPSEKNYQSFSSHILKPDAMFFS